MKTIKLLLLTGLLMVGIICSLWAGEDVWNDVWYQETFALQCDSNTATRVSVAKPTRVGFTVRNPSASYNVYYASYPITAAAQGYTIGTKEGFFKDIYPFNGPIYILSEPGQSLITISFEQSWR